MYFYFHCFTFKIKKIYNPLWTLFRQCSFCTKEVSSIPGAEAIDVNAPRQLRRSSGIPSDRTTCVKTVDLKPDIDPISQVSAHPIISGEIKSSPTREPVSKTLRRSVSSAPTYQGNLGNPVKNGKRTSSTILKTISGLSSKRISMSTSKQTKRCVSTGSSFIIFLHIKHNLFYFLTAYMNRNTLILQCKSVAYWLKH